MSNPLKGKYKFAKLKNDAFNQATHHLGLRSKNEFLSVLMFAKRSLSSRC